MFKKSMQAFGNEVVTHVLILNRKKTISESWAQSSPPYGNGLWDSKHS